MATDEAIVRMRKRADEADEIIATLKTSINHLKNLYEAPAISSLKKENEELVQEVNRLRKELIAAETANGLSQVQINSKKPSVIPSKNSPRQTEVTKTDKDTPNQPAKQNNTSNKKKAETKPKPAQPSANNQPAAPVDVSRLDMRIGQIVDVKKHPDADGLYIEEVNVGEPTNRTIISGLVKHVPIEQMRNRKAIFLLNLKPAKMRGVMSQGMIMCGSGTDKVEIIEPPASVEPGDRVTVNGYPGACDALLNPKKKVWEQVQPDLKINKDGFATYRDSLWLVEGKGNCKVPTMRNSPIK